jgi:hypothetical protein
VKTAENNDKGGGKNSKKQMYEEEMKLVKCEEQFRECQVKFALQGTDMTAEQKQDWCVHQQEMR